MPPRKSSDRYLVVSLSARALAASLSSAGHSIAAIDVFCDQDLCQIPNMDNVQKVSVFDTPNLLQAINQINEKTPCNYLIYGGGIESCPELLDQLPANLTLLGNPANVLQLTKNPQKFFQLLDQLDISYPETIFEAPETAKDWLIKEAGSCGGSGVSVFEPDQIYSSSSYFQQNIQGRVCSVVFVANSQTAAASKNYKIWGYNEIWTESDSSFRFSGAITLPDFPESLKKIIDDHLQLLTDNLGLTGLCGMDFIIDAQNKVQVIEINPRPTTTFELHDQKGNLMMQHLNACKYAKIESDRKTDVGHTYGKQVYYSENSLKVDQEIEWPEWIADPPHAGQIIKAHEPVCTIYADGENVSETKKLLRERMLLLEGILV